MCINSNIAFNNLNQKNMYKYIKHEITIMIYLNTLFLRTKNEIFSVNCFAYCVKFQQIKEITVDNENADK